MRGCRTGSPALCTPGIIRQEFAPSNLAGGVRDLSVQNQDRIPDNYVRPLICVSKAEFNFPGREAPGPREMGAPAAKIRKIINGMYLIR